MHDQIRPVAGALGPFLMRYLSPFILRNGHTQTLMAHLLAGPAPSVPTRRHRVDLGDGDALVVHDSSPVDWRPGDATAVVVHGLTGSHRSPMIARIAGKLYRRGVRVARIDLRGAGAGFSLARRMYHVGRSDDLSKACRLMASACEDSPMLLIGLSLGANIVLKMLSDPGECHGLPIKGAWVACPPVDPAACVAKLQTRAGRIYDRQFVKVLIGEYEARRALFPELPDLFLKPAMTLRDFDEVCTAPANGYRNADHYYESNTTTARISRIATPTTIVATHDDPVVDIGPLRNLRDTLPSGHPVRLVIHRHGGHLGLMDMNLAGLRSRIDDAVVGWAVDSAKGFASLGG
ncbi:MAG: alpha/beta fold hydrolase [Planctomycetes bacterium]|nr:alpha/beta fold hydrolase [Planctomycetota bacterium]